MRLVLRTRRTHSKRNAQRVDNLFHRNIDEVQFLIVQPIHLHEYVVRGVRGAVALSPPRHILIVDDMP